MKVEMEVAVARLFDLPMDALAPLLAESERQGWRFVRRLANEWADGTNRFDRPGELLLAAWVNSTLAGVCGLTVDPYTGDPAIGRVRHLYILAQFRSRRVGQLLVQEVVRFARGRFRSVRVRTENAVAARLYERLGFVPAIGSPDCTHSLALVTISEPTREADRPCA
jgi:GNAT superfamily N-acetyltransferase